jgi:hypothetical protein
MKTKKIPFKPKSMKIDKEGYVINESSIEKVQTAYRSLLEKIKKLYLNRFGKRVYTIAIRGSVGTGEAIPNISDLDAAIVIKDKLNHSDLSWNAKTIKNLQKEFPFVKGIDITLINKRQLFNLKEYKNLKIYLKTNSFCLYGKDITKEIPKVKPGRNLAIYMYGDIIKELKEVRNKISGESKKNSYLGIKRPISFWCRWAMRITLRSSLGLVMMKKKIYTKNTKKCLIEFSRYFPEYRKDMKKVFDLEIKPSDNKEEVLEFINYFIPKYERLWNKYK